MRSIICQAFFYAKKKEELVTHKDMIINAMFDDDNFNWSADFDIQKEFFKKNYKHIPSVDVLFKELIIEFMEYYTKNITIVEEEKNGKIIKYATFNLDVSDPKNIK